uniref:Uncharacterized protein n=1 Tax=Avena sativa TaxID=4498 RepID=A0ACD5WMI7_AVESA
MAMQMQVASPDGHHYVPRSPPLLPPPPPPPLSPPRTPAPAPAAVKKQKSPTYTQGSDAHAVALTTVSAPATASSRDDRVYHDDGGGQGQVLDGIILVLRAGAALSAFVAMALVASCRHGDWMDFLRYQEYRYLLGASVVAFMYSAVQALRKYRRMRRGAAHASFFDFAGDQVI